MSNEKDKIEGTPNLKIGETGGGGFNKEAQIALKNLIKDQGDFNYLVEDSINLLKRQDSYYQKLEARVASLNKGTINIRNIQNEITRAKQKEFIANQTFKSLNSQLLLQENKKSKELYEQAKAFKEQGKSVTSIIEALQEKGDLLAVAAFSGELAIEQAKTQVEIIKEELALEKQINGQLGIAGELMKTLSEKLGLGDDVYEAMTLKARQLVSEKKMQLQLEELAAKKRKEDAAETKKKNAKERADNDLLLKSTLERKKIEYAAQLQKVNFTKDLLEQQNKELLNWEEEDAKKLASGKIKSSDLSKRYDPKEIKLIEEYAELLKILKKEQHDLDKIMLVGWKNFGKWIGLSKDKLDDFKLSFMIMAENMGKRWESMKTSVKEATKRMKDWGKSTIDSMSKAATSTKEFFKNLGPNLKGGIDSLKKSFTGEGGIWKTIQRGPNWTALGTKFKLLGGMVKEAYKNFSFKNLVKGSATAMSGMTIGWKVLGAGAGAFFTSIKDRIQNDPLMKYGLVIGGIALAFKAAGKAADFVGDMAGKAGNAVAGFSEDSGNNIRNLTSGVSSLLKNIPLIGGLLAGLVDGFSAIADLLIGVDNMIVKAGRSLNMSNAQVRALNSSYQDVSATSGNVYMTSRDYLQTLVSINEELGTNNVLSKSSLETSYMLNKYAGLEYSTLSEIEKVSKANGRTQQGVVVSILAQAKGLERATGIQFNQQALLKELAGSTGYIGLQFTKYPEKLTKSLLTVKSLGLELKELEGIADTMLDFESSVSKEFEAQLITGKNINLSKVRQLALDNDLAGMALEINKQIGSSQDFMNMNRIAQEAYAGAVGMSRDSLAEMLRKQEFLSRLGAKDTDNAREQLRLGLEKYKSEEKLEAALGRQAYKNLVNASTQERLMEYIEKIKQSVVDFLDRSGIIGKIENFVKMISDPKNMNGIINTIKVAVADFIKFVSFVLADVIEVGGRIANFFTFGKRGDEIQAGADRTAAKFREFGLQSQQSVLSVGGQMAANAAGNASAQSVVQGATNQPITNNIVLNQHMEFVDGKWVSKELLKDVSNKSDGSNMNSVKTR